MNWLLIIITASNITFSRISDSEESCQTLGEFYTQGIEYTASWTCVNAETIQQLSD
jgi:hypothetical protein